MALYFTKMHGLGNDFAVVDGVTQEITLSAGQIKAFADRHLGIGYDQLLLVEPPSQPDVDFNYRIFNVDGSEVEHCGNGARCFALFVRAKGLSQKNPLTVKTHNRVLSLRFEESGEIAVDMEKPVLEPARLPFAQTEDSPGIIARWPLTASIWGSNLVLSRWVIPMR